MLDCLEKYTIIIIVLLMDALLISETIQVNSLSFSDSGNYLCQITHGTQTSAHQYNLVVTE